MQPALFDAVIRHRRQRFLHFAFQRVFQRLQRTTFLQLLVFIIHHPEGDFQVIGHLIPVPVVAVNGNASHPAQFALQRVQQRQFQRRYAA
ncbi:hypothetical protein D3C73_1008240 [compost metagenome]